MFCVILKAQALLDVMFLMTAGGRLLHIVTAEWRKLLSGHLVLALRSDVAWLGGNLLVVQPGL